MLLHIEATVIVWLARLTIFCSIGDGIEIAEAAFKLLLHILIHAANPQI